MIPFEVEESFDEALGVYIFKASAVGFDWLWTRAEISLVDAERMTGQEVAHLEAAMERNFKRTLAQTALEAAQHWREGSRPYPGTPPPPPSRACHQLPGSGASARSIGRASDSRTP